MKNLEVLYMTSRSSEQCHQKKQKQNHLKKQKLKQKLNKNILIAIKIFRIVSVYLEAIKRHHETQFQAFKNSWAQGPIGNNFYKKFQISKNKNSFK